MLLAKVLRGQNGVSTKIRTRNKTRVSDLKVFVSKYNRGVEGEKNILLFSTDSALNGVYVLMDKK